MATPYHRLARETPAYAWWKLPVAGLLTLAIYIGLSIVLVLGAAIYFLVDSGGPTIGEWLDATGDLDLGRIDFFFLDMLGLVILIPSVLLAVLAVGPRPVGYLSSVAGHLRWGWLARTSALAFVVLGITIGTSYAIAARTDPDSVSAPSPVTSTTVIAILAVLLLVPFQAAAEEYVFRGYLMQLVGSWSRFAFLPVIISTPLFVAGHTYDVWGLLDVGIFGLTAAVLTIRTGGLEAAIATHVANKVVLFVLDALQVVSATDNAGSGPTDLIPSVVSSVVMLVLVERWATRLGIQRTRDPIPDPPQPLMPMWPPPPYAMIWWTPAPWQAEPQWRQPPPPARRPLHPNTPDYPGELPPGWNG